VVNVALFLRHPIDRNAMLAAVVGLAGLALVFYPELTSPALGGDPALGFGLSMLATFFASLGNIISVKLKGFEIPVVQSNAFGMSYGALFCILFSLATGAAFDYDFRTAYSISLVGLALFASVFGFGAYLTLVQKIGAGRAGYTSVMFPIIALILSTFLEGYRWTSLAVVGVALVLSGNLILLLRRKPAVPLSAPQLQKGSTG
jgi:drug/metabolite transporter (DMT)-like permease